MQKNILPMNFFVCHLLIYCSVNQDHSVCKIGLKSADGGHESVNYFEAYPSSSKTQIVFNGL